MSYYKILLVDDEEEIRSGIIKKINWEELGFEVVGEAENGIEALDIIDKTKPDLVFTDIRMPFMDGIKLTENIKYRFPTTKVVVLSGFDDFEYAQAGIKLGILRYILKPINSVEMREILLEIKADLDEEIASKNNIEVLKAKYEKSIPILKERFFNQWIEDYMEEQLIEENIRNLDIPISSNKLIISVIRMEQEIDKVNGKNKGLLKLALFNICEEVVEQKKIGIIFMRMKEMIIITPLEQASDDYSLLQILEEMRLKVLKYLGIKMIIGVGNVCENRQFLYQSYHSALDAFEYTVLSEENAIIYIEDMEPKNKQTILLEEWDEKALLSAIKVGKEEEIKKSIKRLLMKLEGHKISIRNYQIYILEILASMLKLARGLEVELSYLLEQEENFLMAISGFKSKKEIKVWLIDFSNHLSRQIIDKRDSSKNELVEKAKEYIQTHYNEEEINEERVCKCLHISTNYFSALFKKEVQLTFSSYLTRVRIEKAKELLRETKLKNFEIGHQVGYGEPHYFSYVFKKVTGLSPTEYRNGKNEKH